MVTTSLTQSIQVILNKQIANWGLLYVKLHNFHWYVKGNQFFTLHVKFEELYNEAALNV
ncbi:Dps family protein, partial [Paenibacillus sp. TAF58]